MAAASGRVEGDGDADADADVDVGVDADAVAVGVGAAAAEGGIGRRLLSTRTRIGCEWKMCRRCLRTRRGGSGGSTATTVTVAVVGRWKEGRADTSRRSRRHVSAVRYLGRRRRTQGDDTKRVSHETARREQVGGNASKMSCTNCGATSVNQSALLPNNRSSVCCCCGTSLPFVCPFPPVWSSGPAYTRRPRVPATFTL